ncbi:unnamed protein product [Eruca vesicaria subsp. sativa]|uniref:Uncharacterized protein n=1 Tax=Eruca vesicaria subsp. sativa TaxID=29727 RepID=A0ABC8JBR3_ERUVS|nr:unnamed protein product [Eruca vesicaria subsp. sativa]
MRVWPFWSTDEEYGSSRSLRSLRLSVSVFQSEQIWVRSDLAFAGMDGEALPPLSLNGTGLYPFD